MMTIRDRRKCLFIWGMLLLVLVGCANPTHLVFYQSTVLGVDVATNAQGGTVHATLGYDRQTTAFVPKTRVTNDQGQNENDAMSVISRTEIDIEWLAIQSIHETFATGKAALNIADNPDAIRSLAIKRSN